ncbi:MAG: molybdopterin molybdotransferase [Verrucomicrobiota bacterium]|jgi:molybdopterin molybdotransferase
MLSLEEAREKIGACIRRLPVERVALGKLAGRFLAEPIEAPIDLPPFDNSAMDGYALRAADASSAGPEQPVPLKQIGRAAAGENFRGAVEPGACVRVFTGSPLPAGADAVIMQEDTRIDAGRPDAVFLLDAVKPWENVRFRGEDVRRGTVVLREGTRITATKAGLLAALGIESASVHGQPAIALLATGNELLEPGQPLEPGRIFESNRVALESLVSRAGAIPRVFGLVRDNLPETCRAMEKAFATCDAVITTGGVSVGEMDFVKAAFEQLGGKLEFWKVSIRPGKPFVFGQLGNKLLFGLPGNPVSAVVTFLVLVRPALLQWQGAAQVGMVSHPARLAEAVVNHGDRRHFVRVSVDLDGAVRLAGGQASHMVASLASADGLVDVPPNTSWPEGTAVPVLRFDD